MHRAQRRSTSTIEPEVCQPLPEKLGTKPAVGTRMRSSLALSCSMLVCACSDTQVSDPRALGHAPEADQTAHDAAANDAAIASGTTGSIPANRDRQSSSVAADSGASVGDAGAEVADAWVAKEPAAALDAASAPPCVPGRVWTAMSEIVELKHLGGPGARTATCTPSTLRLATRAGRRI